MGFWSWLFPSPADRVDKARRLLAANRAADARLQVLDNDAPGARELLIEAETRLARANLEAALSYGQAGDEQRVHTHLELAESFHHGGLEEEFRRVRRELREIREQRSEAERRAKEERDARLMSVDPLGFAGGPSWLDPQIPPDLLDPDREELEARLALLVENYPDPLRDAVTRLGAPFARAVLDLEDGRPDLALQALLALPDDEPLVRWERARSAHLLGDPAAAARSLRALVELTGRHHRFGAQHSGVYLAQLLAEAGDTAEALRVLRDVRAREPGAGGILLAQLLEARGELAEAEAVLTGLIEERPQHQPLYALLARVRLAGGHRTQAMRALEGSLEAVCCTPGKCGYQPPSLDIVRTLAILYLEDGIERDRALELAAQAMSLVQQPTWDDAYLRALAARAEGRPEAAALAAHLHQLTPAEDPRAERLAAHLPMTGALPA